VLHSDSVIKLKFHGNDTDTDIDTDDPRAEVGAACRGARGSRSAVARAAHSARRLVRGHLYDTRAFPGEDVHWGRAHVHVYVYCT